MKHTFALACALIGLLVACSADETPGQADAGDAAGSGGAGTGADSGAGGSGAAGGHAGGAGAHTGGTGGGHAGTGGTAGAAGQPDLGPLGAFPGCQGSGCLTRGGFAAGSKVSYVTSLAGDSGEGTLGACIAASRPRVCLFSVAGTIDSTFAISGSGLTIDARGAPPGGIQIMSSGSGTPIVHFEGASDIVVRGLKIRPTLDPDYNLVGGGDPDSSNKRTVRFYDNDGNIERVVLDHNSFAYGNGSCLDFWIHAGNAVREITLSWNVNARSFNQESGKNNSGRGMITGITPSDEASTDRDRSLNIDLHHNFFHTTGYRNPEYKTAQGRVVNNYLYNYGRHGPQIAGSVTLDLVGNTVNSGPMTNNADSGAFELDYIGGGSGHISDVLDLYHGGCPNDACYYVAGNLTNLHADDDGSSNWTSGAVSIISPSGDYQRETKLPTSSTGIDLVYDSAANAKAAILAPLGAGASYRINCGGAMVAERDSLDATLITEEATGGGLSQSPIEDPTLPAIPAVETTCAPTTRDNSSSGPDGACVCADTDSDGIPDYWENGFCGSANGCDASGTNLADPWTNLEAYLSGMMPAP